jgi:hypothetical protein
MNILIYLSMGIIIITLIAFIIVPNTMDSVIRKYYAKSGKIYRIFNPCKKCLVAPICREHKQCERYQNWYFKKLLCDHKWQYDRTLMMLPTSLMYSCKKCGKLK